MEILYDILTASELYDTEDSPPLHCLLETFSSEFWVYLKTFSNDLIYHAIKPQLKLFR